MGRRIGRWAVIAVLEDGRIVRGQNRPAFPQHRTDAALRGAEGVQRQAKRRRHEEAEMRAQNRRIREVLGVPVR